MKNSVARRDLAVLARRDFGFFGLASIVGALGCVSSGESEMPRNFASEKSGIKRVNQKQHPMLDWSYWDQLSEKSKSQHDIQFRFVHPLDFISYSRWRDTVSESHVHNGVQTATDLVFWTADIPTAPFLTRTGGIPYRENHLPWPTKHGIDLTFVGQLCFLDSIDILPTLPGNLLLIFATDLNAITEGGPDDEETGLHLEWVTIENVKKPVSKADCPAKFHVPQYSGVLHRYFDWQFGTRDSNAIVEQFANLDISEFCYYVNCPVTKISSAYVEVQSGWDPREWIGADKALRGKWKLIGTFYGIELIHQPGKHFLDDPFENQFELFGSENLRACIDLPGDPGHLVLFSGDTPDKACGYLIGG